jgi:hypothetical protein
MSGPGGRLGVVADVHLGPPGTPPTAAMGPIEPGEMLPWLDAAVDHLAGVGVDALALLGDLSQLGDEESTVAVLDACARAGCPLLAVAGNHDLLLDDATLEAACRASAADVTFLGPEPFEWRPGVWIGGQRVGAAGAATRATALPRLPDAGEGLLVWLSHYPPISRAAAAEAAGLPYFDDLVGGERVAAQLGGFGGAAVVLHGHTHFHDFTVERSLLQLGLPALSEGAHEVAILELAESSVALATHALATDAAPARPVAADPAGRWTFDAARGGWSRQ